MSKASLELGGGNWGTKDGNLLAYAQGNESSKFIPREFTFTRGSDIAATRINSSGLIEKYRENLLLKSNLFDNGGVPPSLWSTSNASVTSGQSGYDGSSNAWLFTATNTSANLKQSVSSSNVNTFSIYAKAGTQNGIFLRADGGDNPRLFFKLNTGTIGSQSGTIIDSSIESVGNGWYRVSLVVNVSITQVRIYVADDNNTFPSSGSIYIQDAQLEKGLVATSYLDSGATTATSGVADNEPRINYAGGTASLLLEPSRTNIVTQSEYFGGYSNSNSTDEPNATTSPEGLTNATSFLEAATTGQHKLFTSLTFDGSSTYTFSIFAKSNGRDLYVDTQNSNEWGGRAWFDLTAGTANAVLGTADIKDYGNGWYRCIVTGASTLAGGNFIELLTSNGSSNSTTGDITKGVYIYGAQLEIGSYATSYIPTYGTSVTRNADGFQKTGASGVIGQTEGTLYIEAIFKEEGNLSQWFSLTDGTANNWVFIGKDNDDIRGYVRANNIVAFTNQTFQITNNTVVKAALSYKSGSISLYINGSLIASSTNSFSFNQPLDTIYSTTHNSQITREKVNFDKILVFKNALTNAECITLTT